MKKLSGKTIKGLVIASSIVTVGVFTTIIGINSNTLKARDKVTLSLVQNQVGQAKEKIKEANKAIEKATKVKEEATKEVETAEKTVKKAEEEKKIAEEEVKNAKTDEEKKIVEDKIKAIEEKIKKAEEEKKTAEEKVKKAEDIVKKAEEEKKVAQEEIEKVEEEKKITKQETKTTTQSKATTQSKTTEGKKSTTNSETKQPTVTNAADGSSKSLTDEQLKYMLEQAKKGEEIDRENYEKALEEKGIEVPEEKHTVEFHFFNTSNSITVRRHGDEDYWSKCGKNGQGCIWFVEFSCNMNECVGFSEPGSGALKDNVLIGRRGDILEYTMDAPKGKPGYRFKQWEVISANKNITDNGYDGVLISKYIAIYEKY